MTERDFEKLRPGDQLMNRRGQGVVLHIVAAYDVRGDVIERDGRAAHLTDAVIVESNGGVRTKVAKLRHLELQRYCEQEELKDLKVDRLWKPQP